MLEFFTQYPWLIAFALIMLVPVTAILIAVPFENWRKVREAETEASLKHAMLERGMSAEEIATVINAGKSSKHKHYGFSHFGRNIDVSIRDKEPSRVL